MSQLISKLTFLVFLILILQGSLLGLSDDEAYYWVLSQIPSMGYAFHPPGVAWLIYLSSSLIPEALFSSTFSVRLPAALLTALSLFVALHWVQNFHRKMLRATLVILSFVGFSGLSWMVVPDNLLFLALTLLFVSTARLCKSSNSNHLNLSKMRNRDLSLLFLGSLLIPLSKYSGVLAVFSSATSFLFFGQERNKLKPILILSLGFLIGMFPALIWNYQHNWASLLYQIHDRHVGSNLSWVRYLRFWASQFLLAGPPLIGFTLYCLIQATGVLSNSLQKKSTRFLFLYGAIWILPPFIVFCIQPLFSDFKIHWAFVVWWPTVLVMAALSVDPRLWKWIRLQVVLGLSLSSLIFICCHYPVIRLVYSSVFPQKNWESKWDVTNDFYGWSELAQWMKVHLPQEDQSLSVVGSRYQTASQAYFVLKNQHPVTFVPRSSKEFDEWPDLSVLQSKGPDWPKLLRPVLYVMDNRYDLPPQFPESSCLSRGRLESSRFGVPAKWIEVWRCAPKSSQVLD